MSLWKFIAWERAAKVKELEFEPFGLDPKTFTGADFYDGKPNQGMLVFKTAKTYDAFTPVIAGDVEVLVVAGGGSGGSNGGAGGGAGGLLYDSGLYISKTPITVTVGAGGLSVTDSSNGNAGGDSIFSSLSAIGGGYGAGGLLGSVYPGGSGGSGGGGARDASGGSGNAGPPRQGYDGGAGQDGSGNTLSAGGGGGAGGAGSTGITGKGGDGGIGLEYFGQFYAGGGGGIVTTTDEADQGDGGSGVGGDGVQGSDAQDGTINTGSGGGGTRAAHNSGAGADGIVIVRWGGYNKNYDPADDSVWAA